MLLDRVEFRLADIPWEPAAPDGTRGATLVGTRDPGVAFTYAFFVPADVWDRPHSHPAAAHLVVASGELRLGYGRRFDTGRRRGVSGRLVPARSGGRGALRRRRGGHRVDRHGRRSVVDGLPGLSRPGAIRTREPSVRCGSRRRVT